MYEYLLQNIFVSVRNYAMKAVEVWVRAVLISALD
jgi:hypothetical protein